MKTSAGVIILVGVLLTAPGSAASIVFIDQANPEPFETSNGSLTASFGQSFTPAFAAIDAFECLLGGLDATVMVQLRYGLEGFDGLAGDIVAQSLPVTVDLSGSDFFLFPFPDRVPLTPGEIYVAELKILSGSYAVRHTQNNRYAGGQFLHGGWDASTFLDTDLVFAEGLMAPVPIPGVLWLLTSGLAGMVALRSRHRRTGGSV